MEKKNTEAEGYSHQAKLEDKLDDEDLETLANRSNRAKETLIVPQVQQSKEQAKVISLAHPASSTTSKRPRGNSTVARLHVPNLYIARG